MPRYSATIRRELPLGIVYQADPEATSKKEQSQGTPRKKGDDYLIQTVKRNAPASACQAFRPPQREGELPAVHIPAPPPKSIPPSASSYRSTDSLRGRTSHKEGIGSSRPATGSSSINTKDLTHIMLDVLHGSSPTVLQREGPASAPSSARSTDRNPRTSTSSEIPQIIHSIRSDGNIKVSAWPLLRTPSTDAPRPLTAATTASTRGSSQEKRARLVQSARGSGGYGGPLLELLNKDIQRVDVLLRNHCTGSTTAPHTTQFHRDSQALAMCGDILKKLHHAVLRQEHTDEAESTILIPSFLKTSKIPSVLMRLLNESLVTCAAAQWKRFEEITLPNKIETEIVAAYRESVAQLEAVDEATIQRIEAQRSAMAEAERQWEEERERYIKEMRALESLTVIDDETLAALDRRFHVLFERHSQEHILAQEAKQRLELADKLRRNEKVLRSEIKAAEVHLEVIQERKNAVINAKTLEVKRVLDTEAEMIQETQSLLSEKRWIRERQESMALRQNEETKRTRLISDEIAAMKQRVTSNAKVEVGPHLTPRPEWTERLETISACKLPQPKCVRDMSQQATDGALSVDPSSFASSTGKLSTASLRRDSLAGTGEELRRATAAIIAVSQMRKRGHAPSMGGKSIGSFSTPIMEGSIFSLDGSSRGGRRGTAVGRLSVVPSSGSSSFVEFADRLRERLTAQYELFQLAQEKVSQFRAAHHSELEVIGNVCALNVASAAFILPKQIATAVAPINSAGLALPPPQWSSHEVSQRCATLWSLVLDTVIKKGDVRLTSAQQTSSEDLVLLMRPASSTDRSRSSAFLSLVASNGNRASTAAPEPSAFPALRSGSASSSTSGTSNRQSFAPAPLSADALSASKNINGWTSYLQAVSAELQFGQLMFYLERTLEYHLAQCPLVVSSGGGGDGTSGSGPQRSPLTNAGRSPSFSESAASQPSSAKGLSEGHHPSFRAGRGKKYTEGVSTSPFLGDALKPILAPGVDAETGQELCRLAVATATAVVLRRSPIRLLEDVGTFFGALQAEVNAQHEALKVEPLTVLEAEKGYLTSGSVFDHALRTVCDVVMGFGCAATSELGNVVRFLVHGDSVPVLFGGAVSQSPDALETNSMHSDMHGRVRDAVPAGSMSVSGRHNRGSEFSPARSQSLIFTCHPYGSSLGTLNDAALLKDRSSWSLQVVNIAQGNAQSSGILVSPGGGSSSPQKRSLMYGSLRKTATSPMSESLNPADPAESNASSTAPPAYQRLFCLAPCWDPLLQNVVKQLQLQQHQLLYCLCRVLIESCYQSDANRWLFLVPAHALESKLPLMLLNADDPVFPDLQCMMDYYTKYPPAVANVNRDGSGRMQRSNSKRFSNVEGASMTATLWRWQHDQLLESLIHACDTLSGRQHFGLLGGTKTISAADSPIVRTDGSTSPKKGFAAMPPLQLVGGAAKTTSSNTAGVPTATTAESPPPPTSNPLGVFLRYSQQQAKSAAAQYSERFMWRNPTTRAPSDVDYYDVEEVFEALSTLQLRQFIRRCT